MPISDGFAPKDGAAAHLTESEPLTGTMIAAATIAAAAYGTVLRVFFSFLLCLVLAAGFYMLRNRKKFFAHHGDESDSYASANLRMWLVILVWIHAVIITTLMIFEV